MMTISAFAVGQFAFVTSVFLVVGLLPAMAAEFNLPLSTVAQAVGLFSLVYALAAPILSAAAGTANRRWLLIGAVAVFSLSNVVAAMTTDFNTLLSMRMVGAACDGFYAATATAIAASMASPERRGRALSIVNSGITVAFVIGVPLGTFIGYSLGWRAGFWFLAIVGAISTAGLMISLPRDLRLTRVASIADRVGTLLQPSVLVLVCVTVLSYAGVFAVYTFIAPALKQLTGLQGASVSAYLMIFGVSAIVGNWAGGYLTDVWKPSWTMMGSFLALAVMLAFYPALMSSAVGAAVMMAVLGFVHYAALCPLQHRFVSMNPAQADVVMGLCFSAFYLGIAAAALIGGRVLTADGISSLGYAAGALKLGAAGALAVSLYWLNKPAAIAKLPVASGVSQPSVLMNETQV